MRVVCLAGGVGGAKLADGLRQVLGPGELTVVVNTGDDFEWHRLLVCPDHDTVMYTLAGLADSVQGWGLAGETWRVMDELARLGGETWFRVGDRDLATHLYRTRRLDEGARLTDVALELQRAMGVAARILPMADEPVRTQVLATSAVDTAASSPGAGPADGWLDFQDYFVRLHQEPVVHDVRFVGAAAARPTAEVLAALAAADAVVVAPSNPIVSVGPILAIPGLREAVCAVSGRPIVAVSGIVGGRALKGPADRMLASLGDEVSALGVARRYRGLAGTFVLDEQDRALEPAIAALGMRAVVTDTVMTDVPARARLAAAVVSAAGAAA